MIVLKIPSILFRILLLRNREARNAEVWKMLTKLGRCLLETGTSPQCCHEYEQYVLTTTVGDENNACQARSYMQCVTNAELWGEAEPDARCTHGFKVEW